MNGSFVISLDFEGMWGSIGSKDIIGFSKRTKENPEIIKRILLLFSEYQIHATWGVVGALGCRNYEEVLSYLINDVYYYNWQLSLKEYISGLWDFHSSNAYFAPELVKMISNEPNQEIGSHTFSHIYINEKGVDQELIWQDISASQEILERYGKRPISIILPRNQYYSFIDEYLKKASISVVRGNPKPIINTKSTLLQRAVNFANCYIKLSCTSYDIKEIKTNRDILNVRSSMFFRSWHKKLWLLEPLKLWRIKNEMRYAAKKGKVFHLWWHPHNMATKMDKNFYTLKKILETYDKLNKQYGFQSLNMCEVVKKYLAITDGVYADGDYGVNI